MSTNTYTDPVFTTELREWIQNDTEEYEYVPEWRPFSGGWNEKLHRDVFTFKGHKHTEEWKEAHSKRMSGKNNPMYGKKRLRDEHGNFVKAK